MADDLVLINWNVEKKSSGSFSALTDTPELISRAIADEVQARGARGADTPFVSYLLEIKGSDASVAKMCDQLRDTYRSYSGRDVRADRINVGGATHTNEWVIALSQGVEIRHEILDIQSELAANIQADKDQARERYQRESNARVRRAASNPYPRREEHYRRNLKEKEWFRNGVISDIKVGNNVARVATAHSPNPRHVKDFPESVDAAIQVAVNKDVDVLLGDFNRDGNFGASFSEDLIRPKGIGTTLSKSAAKKGISELGVRMRDRVFNFYWDSKWTVTAHDPVIKGRSALEPRLTDHAMIAVGLTPKPPMPEFRPNLPFMGEEDYYATLGMNPLREPDYAVSDPFRLAGGSGAGTAFSFGPPQPPQPPFMAEPFTSPFPANEPARSPFEQPAPPSADPFGNPERFLP